MKQTWHKTNVSDVVNKVKYATLGFPAMRACRGSFDLLVPEITHKNSGGPISKLSRAINNLIATKEHTNLLGRSLGDLGAELLETGD
jgi:hypothetical protein